MPRVGGSLDASHATRNVLKREDLYSYQLFAVIARRHNVKLQKYLSRNTILTKSTLANEVKKLTAQSLKKSFAALIDLSYDGNL